MTYEEFVNLVMSMRAAQRAYFHERTRANLQNAKTLERSVDEAALNFLEDLAAVPDVLSQQALFAIDPDLEGGPHGWW